MSSRLSPHSLYEPTTVQSRLAAVLDVGMRLKLEEAQTGEKKDYDSWQDLVARESKAVGFWIWKMPNRTNARAQKTSWQRLPNVTVSFSAYNIIVKVGSQRFSWMLDLSDLRNDAMRRRQSFAYEYDKEERQEAKEDTLDVLLRRVDNIVDQVELKGQIYRNYRFLISKDLQAIIFDAVMDASDKGVEWIKNHRSIKHDKAFKEVVEYESEDLDRGVADVIFLGIVDEMMEDLEIKIKPLNQASFQLSRTGEAAVSSSVFDTLDFETEAKKKNHSQTAMYFVMGKLMELKTINESGRKASFGLFWKNELIAVIEFDLLTGFFLKWTGRLAENGAKNLSRRYARHLAYDMTTRNSVLYSYRYDPRSRKMRWVLKFS